MKNKILAEAIMGGQVTKVKSLLLEEPDLINQEFRGWFPLEYISECKSKLAIKILSILVENGADLFQKYPKRNEYFYIDLLRNNKYELFIEALHFLSEDLRWQKFKITIFCDIILYATPEFTRKAIRHFIETYGNPGSLNGLVDDKKISVMIEGIFYEKAYDLIFFLLDNQIIDKDFYSECSSLTYMFYNLSDQPTLEQFLTKYKPSLAAHNNFLLHAISRHAHFECFSVIEEYDSEYFQKNIHVISSKGLTPLHISLNHYIRALFAFTTNDKFKLDSSEDSTSCSYDSDSEASVAEKSEGICKQYLTTSIFLIIKGARPDQNSLNGENAVVYLERLRSEFSTFSKSALMYSDMTINFLKKMIYFDVLLDEIDILFTELNDTETVFEECHFTRADIQTELKKYRQNYAFYLSNFLIETKLEIEDDGLKDMLNTILESLTRSKIISVLVLKLYIKLLELMNINEDRNVLDINTEYFSGNEAVHYTFINISDCWKCFALPGADIAEASKHILTILLYRAHRHSWHSDRCMEGRLLLDKINVGEEYKLARDKKQLYELLVSLEKSEDYFTQNYSDDSDNDQIEKYKKETRGRLAATEKYSSEMQTRSNVHGFFTQDQHLRKPKKLEDKKPNEFSGLIKDWIDVEERAKIHHPDKPVEVEQDLQELNQLITSRKLQNSSNLAELQEVLKNVGTKFFIAQYRGVHYTTKKWNADNRKSHRKFSEIQQPLFSLGAFARSGLDGSKNFIYTQEQKESLKLNAALINHQIACLQDSGPIQLSVTDSKTKKSVEIGYASLGDASQEFYTGDYDGYEKKLATISQKCVEGGYIDALLDAAFLFQSSGQFPTLSTADTPYHALRYAYGIKFYDGEGQDRLRPRWHISGENAGRVERPYSGKVYTFLLDPALYFSLQPNHVISLKQKGQFTGEISILNERETTFFGGLPEGTLIHEHIARYPSFHHESYSNHFKVKYGLDEFMYKEYKEKITSPEAKPHSPQNQFYKFVLAEQLCAYHEVALIEDARLAAQSRGGYLIYRDNHGLFSLVPPRVVPKIQASKNEKKEAAKLQWQTINAKSMERKSQTQAKGWLADLFTIYKVQASQNLEHLLTLCELNKPTEEDVAKQDAYEYSLEMKNLPPQIVAKYFNKICSLLQCYANFNNVSFLIMSGLFNNNISITPLISEEISKHIKLIYLGGSAFFRLLEKSLTKELSNAPPNPRENKRKNESVSTVESRSKVARP